MCVSAFVQVTTGAPRTEHARQVGILSAARQTLPTWLPRASARQGWLSSVLMPVPGLMRKSWQAARLARFGNSVFAGLGAARASGWQSRVLMKGTGHIFAKQLQVEALSAKRA